MALVLADPVDPNRNVASALSRRNLGLFILAAGAYLDQPSERFFEPRPNAPLSKEAAAAIVRARGTHVTVAVLPRPDLVDDTLYPQVRKAARAVADELARSEFAVLGEASAADASSVVITVEVAHPRRPLVRVQDGPPAGVDRAGHFLEKWGTKDSPVLQGPYVRPDGSLGVDTHRAERDGRRRCCSRRSPDSPSERTSRPKNRVSTRSDPSGRPTRPRRVGGSSPGAPCEAASLARRAVSYRAPGERFSRTNQSASHAKNTSAIRPAQSPLV